MGHIEKYLDTAIRATKLAIRRLNKIRLGCTLCDRDDFDGVAVLPADWADIHEIDQEPDSVMQWETHLGVCPECRPSWERPML